MLNEKVMIKMENDEDDLFYFESDHVALKGNKDYSELLKTIVILESQKNQAIQDIDKLIELQIKAIKNPLDFVEKLKNKENLEIPFQQIIPQLPYINWSKYDVSIPEEAIKLINEGGTKYQLPPPPKKINSLGNTYNQQWTSEEQKKLEELLVKFPPEAVEMRRFKKIANELGNRTVQQVTSRVQKYFLKLYRAGLPIPGRIPKTADKRKAHKHQRHKYLLYKPSTFFPETDVPVYMTEDDEDTLGPNHGPPSEISDSSNSHLFHVTLSKKDEISLKIDLLRRIKIEKIKANDLPSALHVGYKCDVCNEEPLKGCRWHCISCRSSSVDFCSDCLISQLNSASCHPLTHELVALHSAEPELQPKAYKAEDPGPSCSGTSAAKAGVKLESSSDSDSYSDSNWNNTTGYNSEESRMKDFDEDYVSDMFAPESRKYNYLDPNFFPELYKN